LNIFLQIVNSGMIRFLLSLRNVPDWILNDILICNGLNLDHQWNMCPKLL
jgi:hypothetical protein